MYIKFNLGQPLGRVLHSGKNSSYLVWDIGKNGSGGMKQEKLQQGRTCRLWDIRSWTKHGLARGYSTALNAMMTQRRKKISCVVLVKRYWMLVMLLGLCQVQEQSVTSKMMRHVCCGTQSLRKIAQHASPLRCFQKIRRIRCAREHGRSRM